jgi:hypothetical protein
MVLPTQVDLRIGHDGGRETRRCSRNGDRAVRDLNGHAGNGQAVVIGVGTGDLVGDRPGMVSFHDGVDDHVDLGGAVSVDHVAGDLSP